MKKSILYVINFLSNWYHVLSIILTTVMVMILVLILMEMRKYSQEVSLYINIWKYRIDIIEKKLVELERRID